MNLQKGEGNIYELPGEEFSLMAQCAFSDLQEKL